jgi:hypothetical protein
MSLSAAQRKVSVVSLRRVALRPLPRLNQDEYARQASRPIAAAVEAPQTVWGKSWPDLVKEHYWRGSGWRNATEARRRFQRQLSEAATPEELRRTCDAIALWGGLRPFSPQDARRLGEALGALEEVDAEDRTALERLVGDRIAATSKVYAMWDPDRWVIYDSRVARALALLVLSGCYEEVPHLTRFPQPPGRTSGRAVVGFPALAANSTHQAVLGFVYASWFARAIAVELDRRGILNPAGGAWSAMFVELALFTAGGATLVDQADEGDLVPGPVVAGGGRMASQAVAALAADKLKEAGLSEAERRLESRNAFRNAVRYAQQTSGRLVRLQFGDGAQRYVVFKEEQPIAAFPSFDGDLNDALVHHELSGLELLTPATALERRRSARAKRSVRDRFLRRGEREDEEEGDTEAHVAKEVLALPAGDPLGEDELLDGVFDDPE